MSSGNLLRILAVLLATASVTTGCKDGTSPPDDAGASRSLVFAGGGIGGGTYTTMTGFAYIAMRYTDLKIKVIPGGGLINLVKVSTGEAHVTIGNVPFMMLAMEGKSPFDQAYPNFRTVMQPGGGHVVVHFAVAEQVPLNTVHDLIERKYPLRVGVDRKGTHDNWIFNHILEHYGASVKDIESWGGSVRQVGYNDQAMLLTDGHLSGVIQNMQPPSASLMEVSSKRELKFLSFPEDLIRNMEALGWQRIEIPVEEYENIESESDVTSVGYLMPIIVGEKVPEDVVYDLTKALCEHSEETRAVHRAWKNFDPKTAWQSTGGELHPGAIRYFKERGYME